MSARSRLARRAGAALRMAARYPARLFNKVSFTAIVVDSTVDRTAALDSKTRFYRSSLGRYSYVGRGTFVESADIGAFCSIGGDCSIGGAAHPLDGVSTSPAFHAGGNILGRNFAETPFDPFGKTVVGNDVWIAHGAHVKSGVHVGTGAVIGMGAVVTKDVGPYEIWAGNPARCIRRRFDEETAEALLSLEWWNWDEKSLFEFGRYFQRPEELLEVISK